MQPEGNWITRAPSPAPQGDPHRQGAGRGRPRALPVLAPPRRSASTARSCSTCCTTGKQKYSSIFNYPTLTWADMGAIGWLVDGAAIMNQVPLCRCSYGPYARAMIRVCKEESFHQRQGFEILWTLMRGTAAQQAMAQDAANRWWWPSLMMFGPPDTGEARQGAHRPVDGLGHQAVQQRRPAPEVRRHDGAAGRSASASSLPDPDLRWNEERGHYDFGADRLGRVLAGDQGRRPVQRRADRARRRGAHEEGAWVREAAPRTPPSRLAATAAAAAERGMTRAPTAAPAETGWPLWEVFVRGQRGLSHVHVGSLHAPDAAMALRNARDVYTRRQEGVSIWVVARRRHHRVAARTRRTRSSTRRPTRSTGTRRSTTCPTDV